MSKIKIRAVLFIFICTSIVAGNLRAQNFVNIRGQVKDAHSGKFLPYAGLRLSGSQSVSIAAADGSFSLKIPIKYRNKRLIVSYLGYKNTSIKIKNFGKTKRIIRLAAADKAIEAVTVRPGLAESLIEKALNEIPNNYPDTAQNYKAYYLETVKDNGEYCEYIELLLNINKAGYNKKFSNDRVQALQGRRRDSLKPSKIYDYVYFIDGPYEALRCDIAKYPKDFIAVPRHYLNFLNPRHFKFYYYRLRYNPKYYKQYIIIDFHPKSRRAFFEGSIVLDRKTLAFEAMHYKISDKRLPESALMSEDVANYLLSQNIYNRNMKYDSYAEYERTKKQIRLKYASINYKYLFTNKSNNTGDTIEYKSELYIISSPETRPKRIGLWRRFMYSVDIRSQIPRSNAFFSNPENIPDLEKFRHTSLLYRLATSKP